MKREFDPELPDCYEYAAGEIVEVRTRCNPAQWEKAVVAAFTNCHGWELHVTLSPDGHGFPRAWCIKQACQVRPVIS